MHASKATAKRRTWSRMALLCQSRPSLQQDENAYWLRAKHKNCCCNSSPTPFEKRWRHGTSLNKQADDSRNRLSVLRKQLIYMSMLLLPTSCWFLITCSYYIVMCFYFDSHSGNGLLVCSVPASHINRSPLVSSPDPPRLRERVEVWGRDKVLHPLSKGLGYVSTQVW